MRARTLSLSITALRPAKLGLLSVVGALALSLAGFLTVPSAAQAALFAPGATLDPGCPPTDISTCGIVSTSTVAQIGTPFYTLFHSTTTDALAEGTTNKYWSNTLFDNRLSATTTLPGITTLAGLSLPMSQLTGTLGVANGGMGTSTAPAANRLLLSDANGNWGYAATSTLGIAASQWANVADGISYTGGVQIIGTATTTGSIIPSADDAYDLGSPTHQWRNVYVGAHSIYVNGQEVLHTDDSQNVNVSASVNQSLLFTTYGTGDLQLNPSGTGIIALKGNVQLSAGKTLRSSDGTPINFSDGTQSGNLALSANRLYANNVNGSLELASNGTGTIFTSHGNFGVGTSSPLSPLAVSGGASVGADYNLAAPTNGLIVEGALGVGTSTPWRAFSLAGTVSSPQFALSYDTAHYAELQEDAAGDLTIIASGGNIRANDQNLYICSGGACPSLTMLGTGNLAVENKITVGSIEQFCPTGYVWVPGEARYGTLPGFCTMKYEAKNSGGVPVSVPAGTPWVSISQTAARTACEALGTGYHLISEPEWMTIADQIATLPINDIDAAAGLQLATGHSDNNPANALDAGTSATDPVVSGCNLMVPLSDAANAYAAGTCELRGAGAGGSTDADKGYYGTGNVWSASGYSAGGNNKSQLRTQVLPNGQVLWDIAGDVWDWTDSYLWSASGGGAASTTVSEMPDAGTWTTADWYQYTAITNYKALAYARPKVSTWSSTNGIGQIYLPTDITAQYRASRRGAAWDTGSFAGVFALALDGAPGGTYAGIAFRCSRYP